MNSWTRPVEHWCRRCGFRRVGQVPVALGLNFATFPCPKRCGGKLEVRWLLFGYVERDDDQPERNAAGPGGQEVIDVSE